MAQPSNFPDWVKLGAMFTYSGEVQKILAINGSIIQTVTIDAFAAWSIATFLDDISAGKIVHAPNGQPNRPPADKRTRMPKAAQPHPAGDRINALFRQFTGSAMAPQPILLWMRAITEGTPLEPWHHTIGCSLIEIGADVVGHSGSAASRTRPGRPAKRQTEAARTRALIERFQAYLQDEGAITRQEWGFLRFLCEKGMAAVGLMALSGVRRVGRPSPASSSARIIMAAKIQGARGDQAETIRQRALAKIIHRRRVAAAWAGHADADIIVAPDDPEVIEEGTRIFSTLRSIRRRAAQETMAPARR
jgi:hypothetical protein